MAKEFVVSFAADRVAICGWILTNVCEVLEHGRVGSHTDQQLELVVGSPQPQTDNQNGQQDGAHGIDPPSDLRTEDGEHQTWTVDE